MGTREGGAVNPPVSLVVLQRLSGQTIRGLPCLQDVSGAEPVVRGARVVVSQRRPQREQRQEDVQEEERDAHHRVDGHRCAFAASTA